MQQGTQQRGTSANRQSNDKYKPVSAHEHKTINECYDKNTIKIKINLKYKNNKSHLIVINIKLIHFQCNNLIDVLIIM